MSDSQPAQLCRVLPQSIISHQCTLSIFVPQTLNNKPDVLFTVLSTGGRVCDQFVESISHQPDIDIGDSVQDSAFLFYQPSLFVPFLFCPNSQHSQSLCH